MLWLTTQGHADAGGYCKEFLLLIENFTFDPTDGLAVFELVAHDPELGFPDGPHKIYFQLQRAERFAVIEQAGIRHSHGRIREACP